MRRTTAAHRTLAAAAMTALLITGCSGDDPEVEEPTTSETSDAGAEGTTDEEATTEDGAGGGTDEETTTEDDAGEGTDEEATTEAATTDDGEGAQDPPPAGTVTSDDGAFEVTTPEAWVNVREQVEQQVEIAVRDDEMTDDFFTNLVVASEEPIGDLADSIEAAAEQVAGTDGEYELLDPTEIAGEEAYGFVLTRTTSGVEVAQTQWWVEHGERLYVATFSTAKTQEEAAAPIMEEILSTWTWQD